MIRKEQTISFVDNFSKIMQDYLVNQKPINVINDTKSILSQYEFADEQVRNLAIKYLRPFHELSLIDDKLKSESSLWTSLKDKYLTGRARGLEVKIDEINDMFEDYKMEAVNVQKYLMKEYNIDLKMTEWNFKVLVKK